MGLSTYDMAERKYSHVRQYKDESLGGSAFSSYSSYSPVGNREAYSSFNIEQIDEKELQAQEEQFHDPQKFTHSDKVRRRPWYLLKPTRAVARSQPMRRPSTAR